VTETFADTFYWLALLNPADQYHARAASFPTDAHIVASTAVQLEVLDALSTHAPLRRFAPLFWRRTSEASDITVVPLSHVISFKQVLKHY